MKNEKMIDGQLPCFNAENCPLVNKCGTAWDYKQPNTKKLVCLCKHIDCLAKMLYERDTPNHRTSYGEYAYQLAWLMHNEIKTSADLLQKWNEPLADYATFLECYETFKLFVETFEIGFLRESLQQLRQIANAHSTMKLE